MAHIQYRRGDIFDAATQVIVNTVNCQGIMGKGLALAFKQRYPEMFPIYQEECKTGKLRIGRPTLYKASMPWILNFPTKDTWRANSKLEYLEKGLEYFVTHYKEAGITGIAFPKLGAQNGKLSWDDVGPLMAQYLSQVDIEVYIYIADGDREYQYGVPTEDKNEVLLWESFNELALSLERLQQEVLLSAREAKKIYERRVSGIFSSQADIDNIEKLAQVSKKKIREYLNQQRYIACELPQMEKKSLLKEPKRKQTKTPSRARKSKVPASVAQLSTSLF